MIKKTTFIKSGAPRKIFGREAVAPPTPKHEKTLTAKVFKGKDKMWYATITSRNGNQVWRTGDGYTRRYNAIKAIQVIQKGLIVIAP